MKISDLVNQNAEWLRAAGPEHDVVVSSRIRLARNVNSFCFVPKLSNKDQETLVENVQAAIKANKFLKGAFFFRENSMSETDGQFLVERHLISREHAKKKGPKALALSGDEVVSLMVLEEDHLRLQAFQSGFSLVDTWRIANQIDTEFEKKIDYGFDANLGYLTACPTNVGTGLSASAMLHLPSLVITKQIQRVLQALTKLNVAVRGLYGEGTQASGNLFQFSNQMTLGQSEEEIIENLASVIRQIVVHEREALQHLKGKRKGPVTDQIWRAVGTLKSCRSISSSEATQLLSFVQLGISMGLFASAVTRQQIAALFLLIQPAHLQKLSGKPLNATERDVNRAELVRNKLLKLELV